MAYTMTRVKLQKSSDFYFEFSWLHQIFSSEIRHSLLFIPWHCYSSHYYVTSNHKYKFVFQESTELIYTI